MSKNLSKDNPKQFLNIVEVSELLRMSVSHIYTLTSKKKIPHVKLLGKKLLFEKTAINNWIKEKSVEAK